jgi:hypothetical protein
MPDNPDHFSPDTFQKTESTVPYKLCDFCYFKYHVQVKYTKITCDGTEINVSTTHVACLVSYMVQPLL